MSIDHAIIENGTSIFVTGATGFVGSTLVAKLLIEGKNNIFCLVRPSKGDPKKRLIDAVLEAAEMDNCYDVVKKNIYKLNAIPGDLISEQLGISDIHIDLLRKSDIQTIWHCAAFLKFEEAFRDEVFKHNVDGTKNVVKVAKQLDVENFNYFSTAFVSGEKKGDIDENEYDPKFPPNNPYEESKRVCEDFLLKSSTSQNFHLRIFRPSIVFGNSKSFKTTSDFSFYGYLLALELFIEWINGRMPDYLKDFPVTIYREKGTTVNMIPVDILAEEAIELSEKKNNYPEYYHLSNPYATTIDLISQAVKDAYPDIRFVLTDNINELRPIDLIFRNKLEFYTPYLLNDKNFIRRNSIEQYSDKLNFDIKLLKKYINSFIFELRENRKTNKKKSVKVLNLMEKKTIHCRYAREITYYMIGKGPVVVLLNAYGMSLQAWRDIITSFSKNHTVLTWEARGLSDSVYPVNDSGNNQDFIFTVNEHTRDLREILDSENITEAHLIAWCTGAKTAIQFCAENASMVKSLTIITGNLTPLKGYDEEYTSWSKSMRSLADSLVKKPKLANMYLKTVTKVLTEGEKGVAGESDERVINLFGRVSPKFRSMILSPFLSVESIRNYAKMIHHYLSYDISNSIDLIDDIPMFLISAENDELVNAEPSDIIAEKINTGGKARRLTLPASSHWLIMENGFEVYQELESFIEAVE